MRPLPVAALLLAGVLAGCMASEREAPPVYELLLAEEGGLVATTSIAGLDRQANGSWTWDVFDGMEKDTIRLLAVQALADTNSEYHLRGRVSPSQGPGESQRVESVCTLHFNWREAPGDFFVARSVGQDAEYPDAPFSGTHGNSFGGPGGTGSFYSNGAGRLAAGEWIVFTGGLAGYEPGLAAEEGEWTLDFGLGDAPLRIIELRPTPFHCGSGFDTLPGSSTTPVVERTEGGELSMVALYGGQFDFHPGVDLFAAPAAASNEASVEFMGNVTPLTSLSNVNLESRQPGAITLQNVQWTGEPQWSMRGLWFPVTGT